MLGKDAEEFLIKQKEEFAKRVTFANQSANDFFNSIRDKYKNGVDIVCLDPPYNVLKLYRDQISSTDIKDTVDLLPFTETKRIHYNLHIMAFIKRLD